MRYNLFSRRGGVESWLSLAGTGEAFNWCTTRCTLAIGLLDGEELRRGQWRSEMNELNEWSRTPWRWSWNSGHYHGAGREILIRSVEDTKLLLPLLRTSNWWRRHGWTRLDLSFSSIPGAMNWKSLSFFSSSECNFGINYLKFIFHPPQLVTLFDGLDGGVTTLGNDFLTLWSPIFGQLKS